MGYTGAAEILLPLFTEYQALRIFRSSHRRWLKKDSDIAKFCKILKNTLLTEHLRVSAFVFSGLFTLLKSAFFVKVVFFDRSFTLIFL